MFLRFVARFCNLAYLLHKSPLDVQMLIKGIRSFSPDNNEVIVFYKPLTLIVGHNGAGKTVSCANFLHFECQLVFYKHPYFTNASLWTYFLNQTIIECLRMACTGELPPNTRSGQNFVHDPKVAGEMEVKAQIKLRFYGANRTPFTVVRSFQLTQKKTALQFKALDNTIQTLDPQTGQLAALPYRCSNINSQVPLFMGVSKAVLDNVIFVHQEDSNWPLAEGTVLKKKFDDIFSATKYTKALDELRKMRSKQVQEAKEMRLKLETLKTHKDHAARLRTAVANGTNKVATLRSEIDDLHARTNECLNERQGIDAKLCAMADAGDEIVALKAQYDFIVSKNAETYARLIASYAPEDVEMPLEELQNLERDMATNIAALSSLLQPLERELQSAQLRARALREEADRESQGIGKLQAEAEAHVHNVEDRDRFLLQMCSKDSGSLLLGSTGGGPLVSNNVDALRATFNSKLQSANRELDAARQQHQADDDVDGRALDRLAAEISGISEGLRMKREAVRANEVRIQDLSAKLDADTGVGHVPLEAARNRAAAKERELAEREAELDKLTHHSSGNERNAAEIASLRTRADELRVERKRLAAASEEASRMNFKAQELQAAESKLKDVLRQHRSKLIRVLEVHPDNLPEAGPRLVDAVRAVVERRRADADAKAGALKQAQTKLAGVEGSLTAARQALETAIVELNELEMRLKDGFRAGGGSLDMSASLTALETERRSKELVAQRSDVFCHILDAHVQHAKQHNACPTCNRPFPTAREASQFVETKQQELRALPGQVEQVKSELSALEARVMKLKLLEPVATRHDVLRDREIPDLQSKVNKLEDELASVQAEESQADRRADEAGTAAAEATEALQEAAIPISRLSKEVFERQSELDSLRLVLRVEDATRSVADVDGDLAALEARRADLDRARDVHLEEISAMRRAIGSLRSDLHRDHEEILRLTSAVEKREALEAQRTELLNLNDEMTSDLLKAREAAAPLEERRGELQRRREDRRASARLKIAELDASLRTLQMQHTQLEAKDRLISEYELRGGPELLHRAEAKLASIRKLHSEAEEKVRQLMVKAANERAAAADSEALQRQVADLLAYHRSKNEELALAADMDSRRAAMASVGDRNALEAKSRELTARERELRSEADRAAGALATVEESSSLAARELAAPQYNDIDGKYRRQVIALRTTEMASGDLEKYHKALERALLSFHTTKMSDINKIIKELWQKTYRNSDIDYVQIRADTESGAAQRSYNYRVVMVCGGVELDMRGRCSAGQRVLASLIIRLALAETFCLNCGILALDEPTTNLDSDNATSLAEALKSIMLARREQENFQLIVITHDEAFARNIGTREHAEHMWRIIKDENQHSTVVKEDIVD